MATNRSSSGITTPPPRRSRRRGTSSPPPSTPSFSGLNPTSDIGSPYICPLTRELPIDPATAEDGLIYERAAIAEHILQCLDSLLYSPVTGEPMGPRLTTAFAVRGDIGALVRTGSLRGRLAGSWLARLHEDAAAAEAARIVQSFTGAGATGRLGFWLNPRVENQMMGMAA